MKTFPRGARLKKNEQFVRVLAATSIKIYCDSFGLRCSANGLSHPRLGIVVPKKQIPHAVRRNHFKRLVREEFRYQRHKFKPVDVIVFVNKKAEDFSNHENRLKLQKQLARLCV